MPTVTSKQQPVKPNFSTENVSIMAVDENGESGCVEINLSNRWRQVHGFATRAEMIERAFISGVTIVPPDGFGLPDRPGFFLSMDHMDMLILKDPSRPTLMNMSGEVVELPLNGGRA